MVDENLFFREVTLRLCGSLEIEQGLQACLEYIREHIPADSLYLEKYEPAHRAMRVVARASSKGTKKMDVLVPLPEAAAKAMEVVRGDFRAGSLPTVFVINDSSEEPVTAAMLEILGEPASSAMSLPLMVEGKVVGALAVLVAGKDRYANEHSKLYGLLKEPFFVAMANTVEHEKVVQLKELLADDNRFLNRELRHVSGAEIIGADFGLRPVTDLVRRVAPSDSPVLLLGETGVGKDVIANEIHFSSPRRDGPFIAVNCGAIPDSLLDSELFGHEKGAFTGALQQKRGRFERANKGTLFLDEVGELPPQAQVRLLRVLQEKAIERVGGTQNIAVDIRIIAATNRDLQAMIEDGSFREDLWFRLNVFPITIPPLRKRVVDIPALATHFIERKAVQQRMPAVPALAPGALDRLMAYHWPGNVRELENVVERALILDPEGPLSFDALVTPEGELRSSLSRSAAVPDTSLTLDEAMAVHIRAVLEEVDGRVHGEGGAAQVLGVNPSTLRARMKKLGIAFGRAQAK
jgi:transcriptional regulator with GAF, ATPase, and Fis domain